MREDSEKIKVKISIADRIYPLKIFPEEEAQIREIALNIENLIKDFEKNYAVRDKQDVLAMSTLQFASKVESIISEKLESDKNTIEKLNALNALINQVK